MKNINKGELVKQSKRVWEYNLPLIESCKTLLVHRDHAVLLDLSLKIQAYDSGVLTQARATFAKNNLDGRSVSAFIEGERGVYSKKDVLKIKDKVGKFVRGSFDNERLERIKELVLDEELSHIIPKESSVDVNHHETENESYEPVPIKRDFEENFLPLYKHLREEIARNLQKELDLTDDFIFRLQQSAFDEVLSIANRKSTPHPLSRNSTVSVGVVVGFLERSIMTYFPKFLRDLGFEHRVVPLLDFRKGVKQHFNTVCWWCDRPLFKRNNSHHCTKRENRPCYTARFKEARHPGFSRDIRSPEVIHRTKNKCDNCGRQSPLNQIHHHQGKPMQFCSERCWETFRKRDYRRQKRTNQINL